MEIRKLDYDFTVCKVTDYVFVKSEKYKKALELLEHNGYRIVK